MDEELFHRRLSLGRPGGQRMRRSSLASTERSTLLGDREGYIGRSLVGDNLATRANLESSANAFLQRCEVTPFLSADKVAVVTEGGDTLEERTAISQEDQQPSLPSLSRDDNSESSDMTPSEASYRGLQWMRPRQNMQQNRQPIEHGSDSSRESQWNASTENQMVGSANNNTSSGPSTPTRPATRSAATSSIIFPHNNAFSLSLGRRQQVAHALEKSEASCFRRRRKVITLENMGLKANEIPLDGVGTSLSLILQKLSLSGNPLGSVPDSIVQNLPSLKTLSLCQCELESLPYELDLPSLTSLDLRNNRLTQFPDKVVLEGLPALRKLDLYGNKLSVIMLPDPKVLANLVRLDLGYNDLVYLPVEFGCLDSLRVMLLQNNFLSTLPEKICTMKTLQYLDVSSNPITQPPIEICEGGLSAINRYWKDHNRALSRIKQDEVKLAASQRSLKN